MKTRGLILMSCRDLSDDHLFFDNGLIILILTVLLISDRLIVQFF